MAKVIIVYASRYGQTAAIAGRIARRLSAAGHEAQALSASTDVARLLLEEADAIVVGASVYAGRHRSEAHEFVRENLDLLQKKPSAFFSVSMSASRDTPEGRTNVAQYLRHFSRVTGWAPARVATFAGGLPYRSYNFFTRFIIRQINKRTGGPTDTSRDYEFTDWAMVDAFAAELGAAFGPPPPVKTDEPERTVEPVLGWYKPRSDPWGKEHRS